MDELDDQEVDDEDTKTIAEVYMMSGGPDDVVQDTSGFGVLDIGATETVTSLEALEKLIHLRGQHQGEVQDIRVVAGGRKPFRFGNGEARTSESFILLKQHLGKKTVLLGMYTLNVEKVPILIGIKTLTKLGAIIDVKGQFMVLTSVNAEVKIPLKKSVSGHLLVDLTRNWLEECQPLSQRPQPSASGVYMVAAAEDGRRVEEAEVLRSTVNFEVMSLSSLGQLLQSSEPHMDVMMTSNDESLQVEEDGGRVLEESLVLTVNDGRVCNLAQTDQRMRDQVIDSLARGHRSPSRSHGAQEEDVGETTEGGDLRPQSDHRSADLGPEVQWTSVPWSTRGGGHGTRLSLGSEQVCRVDGMSSLPSTVNLHTPAFGCHGLSRKAGPLATDVEAQIKIHSPQKGSELLKDRTVGLEAAERSLQQRLEVIQAQKKSYQEVQDRKNQSKVKDLQGYPGVQTSKAPTALPSVKNEMAETPGRKARRPEETAEHLEYQNRAQVISDEEEEAWSKVSSPSKP